MKRFLRRLLSALATLGIGRPGERLSAGCPDVCNDSTHANDAQRIKIRAQVAEEIVCKHVSDDLRVQNLCSYLSESEHIVVAVEAGPPRRACRSEEVSG